MGNKKIELESGATLEVTASPFAEAHTLLKALLSAAKGVTLSKKNPLEEDISVIKDAALAAATSEEVEGALFKCCQRATYDGIKITKDLFDDPKIGDQARRDYFIIAWNVIEVNCGPFFGRAFSLLRERLKTPTVNPVSASTSTRH